MTERPRFDVTLTLDEFRVILEHSPAVVLPGTLEAGVLEDSPTGQSRRETATKSLVAEELLDPAPETAGPDEVSAAHPLLLMAFAMPLVAEYSIQVQSWTPATTAWTVVALAGETMAAITITIPRSTAEPTTDVRTATTGEVRVTLGSPALITGRLGALLADAPAEPADLPRVRVEIGLVESRSLMEAIRRGDHALVDQLAARFGATPAVPVLRSMSTTMEAGFRLHSFARPGTPLRALEWFQSSAGDWLSMRLVATPDADGQVTPQALTDSGRMLISRQRRSDITAELLTLVTGLCIGGSHVRG